MFVNKLLGWFNLIAALICIGMVIYSVVNPSVELRWAGFFFFFAVLNGICAYINFKKTNE